MVTRLVERSRPRSSAAAVGSSAVGDTDWGSPGPPSAVWGPLVPEQAVEPDRRRPAPTRWDRSRTGGTGPPLTWPESLASNLACAFGRAGAVRGVRLGL